MILYVANSYIFFLAVFTMSSPTKVLENPELFVCLSIVILSVYLSMFTEFHSLIIFATLSEVNQICYVFILRIKNHSNCVIYSLYYG